MRNETQDIQWRALWPGYLVGLVSTVVAGVPLVIVTKSSWLMAAAGSAGLFVGGLGVGRKAGSQRAVVNGALLSILYNFTMAVAYFSGSFFELLPEPLPGLPQGDSTFFFAWPLAQFAMGILGAILGSRIGVSRARRVA